MEELRVVACHVAVDLPRVVPGSPAVLKPPSVFLAETRLLRGLVRARRVGVHHAVLL